MKKEKYKNFPLIKTFAAKKGNTYLYDGRTNIFLCLSPKESDTIFPFKNSMRCKSIIYAYLGTIWAFYNGTF